MCKLLKVIRDLDIYFGPILIMILLNMEYCYIALLVILLKCGDIESNPGPPKQVTKICHINARSLLSEVDKNLHLESQYSLLDDIYETLIFDHGYDVIGIGETWLSDEIENERLDLVGYHNPLIKIDRDLLVG